MPLGNNLGGKRGVSATIYQTYNAPVSCLWQKVKILYGGGGGAKETCDRFRQFFNAVLLDTGNSILTIFCSNRFRLQPLSFSMHSIQQICRYLPTYMI
jgi:hypothetical protein